MSTCQSHSFFSSSLHRAGTGDEMMSFASENAQTWLEWWDVQNTVVPYTHPEDRAILRTNNNTRSPGNFWFSSAALEMKKTPGMGVEGAGVPGTKETRCFGEKQGTYFFYGNSSGECSRPRRPRKRYPGLSEARPSSKDLNKSRKHISVPDTLTWP